MSRFFGYGPKEDAPLVDGDQGFAAVNAKLAPDQLPAGTLAYAQNARLQKGVAQTRGGIVTPGHFNGPLTADALGNVTSWRWSTIYGVCVYSNPAALAAVASVAPIPEQWTVLATDTGVWVTADGCSPMSVSLPKGESITGPVTFAQAQNQLLMFRGLTKAPMQWNGNVNGTWLYVTSAEVTNEEGQDVGILGLPNASWAIYFANQLFVPVGSAVPGQDPTSGWPTGGLLDQIAVSDILDYTHFNPVQEEFAINSGADESIVAIVPYTGSSLVVFKERSSWLLANVADSASGVTLSVISNTLGCAARLSAVQVGADIIFLCESPPGVYRVNQVIQATVQAAPLPISDPMEPVIRRINWACAAGACGVLYGEYYFLAAPLDDSTVNNAVLVFNTVTGNWEGLDTLPAPPWTAAGGGIGEIDTIVIGNNTTLGESYGVIGGAVTGTGDASVDGVVVISDASDLRPDVTANLPGGSTPYLSSGSYWNLPAAGEMLVNLDNLVAAYAPGTLQVKLYGYSGTAQTVSLTLTGYKGGTITTDGGTSPWGMSGGTSMWTQTLDVNLPAAQGLLGTIYIQFSGGLVTNIAFMPAGQLPAFMAGPAEIDEWMITAWNGAQRLFGVDHANGRVYLYGEGRADRIGALPAQAIPMSVTTRGYSMGEMLSAKTLRRIYLALSTWNPSYTVTLSSEAYGVQERPAVNKTRNPACYITWGKGKWAATNANGDFANPGRQDYAVRCPIILNPSTGSGPSVKLGIEQQTMERFMSRMAGRWGQLTVANAQGTLTLRAAGIEGAETGRATKQTQ